MMLSSSTTKGRVTEVELAPGWLKEAPEPELDAIAFEHRLRAAGPGEAVEIPRGMSQAEANRIEDKVRADRPLVEPMTKAKALDLAKGAVADRGLNYGKPEDNFARIAARWRVHIKNRFGVEVPIDGASVAMMMIDMKLARLENDPRHLDSWVDAAGYAACGAEITGV